MRCIGYGEAKTEAKTGEGFLSADRDPSSAHDTSDRGHLLPQGEKGRRAGTPFATFQPMTPEPPMRKSIPLIFLVASFPAASAHPENEPSRLLNPILPPPAG